MSTQSIEFYDHEVVQNAPNDYIEIALSPVEILDAWTLSMFAHELLNKDGSVKSKKDMNPSTMQKYIDMHSLIKRGEPIPKPVIGIGIMDNLEIGIGREIIAAAMQNNISQIIVNIRKAQVTEIKKLLKK